MFYYYFSVREIDICHLKLSYETVCLDKQTYVSKIPFRFVLVLNFTHKSCIGDKIQSKHCIKSTLIDLINILNYHSRSLCFSFAHFHIGCWLSFDLFFSICSKANPLIAFHETYIDVFQTSTRSKCETRNSIEYLKGKKTSQISFRFVISI